MEPLGEQMLLQILDMLDPIAVFSPDGYYRYVNEQWRRCSGVTLPSETLPQYHPWDLLPDSRVKTVIQTHRPIIGEIININQSPVYVSYLPIFQDGRFEGVLMWQMLQGMERASKAAKMVELLQQELASVHSNLEQIKQEQRILSEIAGDGPAVAQLRREILEAARTDSTVLIQGETGTGKELVARAIHRLSRRSKGRFVPVNCSAIPASLMESEFFGYEEGAFTGAKRGGRAGKLELASGGTLLLDEIHQMDFFMQPKLLRVLQEHQVERLGGNHPISVDFRCIAAANVNLKAQAAKGAFRDDLYYRLNVIHIDVPPLRKRREDIPQLVGMFIDKLNARLGTHIIAANDSALQLLMGYDWPGNIRELQNAVEAAMNRAWDGILETKHFRLDEGPSIGTPVSGGAFRQDRAQFEKDAIVNALRECSGNKSLAAAKLGISRSVLYSKLRKYGLG